MAKFCPECAYPISDKNAQYCAKCGAALPISSSSAQSPITQPIEKQQPTQPSLKTPPSDIQSSTSVTTSEPQIQDPRNYYKKDDEKNDDKERSIFEWIAICVGGLVLLVVVSVVVSTFVFGTTGTSQKSTASAGIPQNTVTLTPTIDPVVQIKNNAQNIPYDTLFRNNENYIGKTVYFRGKIIQMSPVYGDTYIFRVATKSSQYLGYIEDIVYVNYQGSRFLEGDTIDLWAKVDGLKTYTAVLGNSVSIPELTALHTELVSKESDSSSIQPTVTVQRYITPPTYMITTNPTTEITIPPLPLPSTVMLTNQWGDSHGFVMERFTTQATGRVTFKIVDTGHVLSGCKNVPSSQILAGTYIDDTTLTPYMSSVLLPAGKYSISMNGCKVLNIYISNA